MKLAIIHARGGSKRIPRKNVKDFCGKPMISYAIEAAQKSGVFDKIVVSTDCDDIAATAREFGAETPYKRPANLADDYSITEDVLLYDLTQFEGVEQVCCIYATSPFLQPESLQQGLKMMEEDPKLDTAFPATTFPFPIFRSMKMNEDGTVDMFWPEYRTTRSQDLPEAYHDAGQFYWVNPKTFPETKLLFGPKTKPVLLPRYLVQDIDTPEDWERAEYMHQALRHAGAI